MPLLKRIVRRFVAFTLYYSGCLWIFAEFRLRHKAVVLMYHRVLPRNIETFSHEGIIVSPHTFSRQMKFLRKHFAPLTPEQFSEQLRTSGFRRRACLVTFDDGWRDNHQHALPVLIKYSIPAVVFIATAFVGTDKTFWQERLTRLLFTAAGSRAFGGDVLLELGCADARKFPDEIAKRRMRDVVTALKRRDSVAVDRIIERLNAAAVSCGMAPKIPGPDRFLSWAEALEMHSCSLVTIGSHAHSHMPLTQLGYDGVMNEFSRSKKAMDDHGIRRPEVCAYPNGNVDDTVLAAAKASGFTLGFATGKGRTSKSDNPLRLPRINIHESSSGSDAEFLCRILGIL